MNLTSCRHLTVMIATPATTVGLILAGASAEAAEFPASYTGASCDDWCVEIANYGGAGLDAIYCDFSAETFDADATAVFNFDQGSKEIDYSVWGTTEGGFGPDFACYFPDSNASIHYLFIDGSSDGDVYNLSYSSSIYLTNGGDFMIAQVYAADGSDVINGSHANNQSTTCDWHSLSSGYLELLLGGNHEDWIEANEGRDYADGMSGDDYLFGGTEGDCLYGNGDNDEITGGPGDDVIEGGTGNDAINGNGGNDTLTGDAGDDTICGGGSSGKGSDMFYGGADNDIMYAPYSALATAPGGTDTSGTNSCGHKSWSKFLSAGSTCSYTLDSTPAACP